MTASAIVPARHEAVDAVRHRIEIVESKQKSLPLKNADPPGRLHQRNRLVPKRTQSAANVLVTLQPEKLAQPERPDPKNQRSGQKNRSVRQHKSLLQDRITKDVIDEKAAELIREPTFAGSSGVIRLMPANPTLKNRGYSAGQQSWTIDPASSHDRRTVSAAERRVVPFHRGRSRRVRGA